ncbi:unnamed protein product [Nesidiocoris tenuis]|uniref:Uncharacterized protein n=1 Tax=Nesidiocoris tenuis TaxID=355587 RepID=A0A6H5G5Z3_9HEMI|nr:unnamed protein product [Nesidiocoris tenuis]
MAAVGHAKEELDGLNEVFENRIWRLEPSVGGSSRGDRVSDWPSAARSVPPFSQRACRPAKCRSAGLPGAARQTRLHIGPLGHTGPMQLLLTCGHRIEKPSILRLDGSVHCASKSEDDLLLIFSPLPAQALSAEWPS